MSSEISICLLSTAMTSCDSYASFVLSNLPHASITQECTLGHLPFVNWIAFQSYSDQARIQHALTPEESTIRVHSVLSRCQVLYVCTSACVYF